MELIKNIKELIKEWNDRFDNPWVDPKVQKTYRDAAKQLENLLPKPNTCWFLTKGDNPYVFSVMYTPGTPNDFIDLINKPEQYKYLGCDLNNEQLLNQLKFPGSYKGYYSMWGLGYTPPQDPKGTIPAYKIYPTYTVGGTGEWSTV